MLRHLLTPWCRVLLEKLTGLQLFKKFLAFHGTWRFIIALTSVRQLSLLWASPIQSVYPHLTSWRSLLSYSMVQSPSWETNWFAASQEIPCISQNPKVHYRAHKCLPTVSIMGQPNPVHIPTSHLLEILTYLFTPWCRVLENLTGLQLVKKFPAFHGTWRFITALTSVCHLSLLWASPNQSIYPHPTSWTSLLTYLLTYSMVQSPSWEAN